MTVDNDPVERPGWLYPLIVFVVTAAIGAAILWLYIGPGIDDLTGAAVKPTSAAGSARVTIGGTGFSIPENYIRLPSARADGAPAEIELDALLPDFHGFMDGDDEVMKDVSRASPVVSILIRAGAPDMTARERYDRIYARNADPERGQYEFAGFVVTPLSDNSGYAGQQAFSRQAGDEFVVILCGGDDRTNNIGGLCLREMTWNDNLTVIYAFRGGHLQNWPTLDAGVKALIKALEAKPAG
jgi:hypothetical protein